MNDSMVSVGTSSMTLMHRVTPRSCTKPSVRQRFIARREVSSMSSSVAHTETVMSIAFESFARGITR